MRIEKNKWVRVGHVIAFITIVFVLGCSANVNAQPPTAVPTAGIQPNMPPNSAATPNLSPRVTPIPGDPNAPVSNETAMPPQSLPNRTRITGRITDAQANPIAGARITIPKSSVSIPEIAYLSNAEGMYTLSVPPGEFTLMVFADEFQAAEKMISTRGEAQMELNWVLQP